MSIEDYNFSDTDLHTVEIDGYADNEYLRFMTHELNEFTRTKDDVVALAKHFKLTAYDIDCTEFKALQIDANQADEDHFDECVKIQADKIKINKRLS